MAKSKKTAGGPKGVEANTARMKLRDKTANKLKTALELLVVAHKGSFSDAAGRNGVKSTYERVSAGKTLRFNYMWHQTPSDYRTLKNTRSRMHANLQKLDIIERLPSLMVRSSLTYDDDVLAIRKGSKVGRAFLALENAFLEMEEELDEQLLSYNKPNTLGDDNGV